VIIFLIIAAVFLAAFGGLMAAVESAISSVSRADVNELAESSRSQRSLFAIARDSRAHVNAVSFARTVAETTAAVLVTLIFVYTLDVLWIILIVSALVMTGVSFVLVGASPRSVGRVHATMIIRFTAPVVHFIRLLLGPIANILVAFGDRVTPGRTRGSTFSSEEQLLSMVDEAAELEVLEEDDRELIHSVFEFSETVIRGIMVPRTDMITIDANATVETSMAMFFRTGVSRIPVIAGEIDDIVGILYLRDVAKVSCERPTSAGDLQVRELARPALFVPESTKADMLLRQMQREFNH
jgi:CBS domain containing-hemolysin-like protein